ncbi:MAG: indole-3-glycerol phosphate synthase TrpC [Brumimicrobium sp.]|nr:indole-3-glycerol phosphate synthase TrpC [Brumimicrobium sp.]
MHILNEIIQQKKAAIEKQKNQISRKDLEDMPFFPATCGSLNASIRSCEFGLIAEMKRKSPSAGILHKNLDPSKLASEYEQNGAAGISVLTDHPFFGGTNQDLLSVKQQVKIPVLRKDFIIDEYQVFESKAIGADCILLIASVLDKSHLLELSIIAKALGLEVLMEIHEKEELSKLNNEIDILGVNNRDLKKQRTDLSISEHLRPYLPNEITVISESGIKTTADINFLRNLGYHGALIGESIVGNQNPGDKLRSLQFQTPVL